MNAWWKKKAQPPLHEKLPIQSRLSVLREMSSKGWNVCKEQLTLFLSFYWYMDTDTQCYENTTKFANVLKCEMLPGPQNIHTAGAKYKWPREFSCFFFCQDQNAFQCQLANCFRCSIVGSVLSFLTSQHKKSARLLSCSQTDRQVLFILFNNSVITGHLGAVI